MKYIFPSSFISTLAIAAFLSAPASAASAPAINQESQTAVMSAPSLSLSSNKNGVSKSHRGEAKQRARSQAAVISSDFWVYDAFTALQFDSDGDGHYTRLIVDFDVDTSFILADVYARLYLSRDLGPWNEYAVTEDFSVFSAGGDDNYVLESDLVEGFPFGYYDVLIEIYDTFDNSLVAEFGPADSAELSELPLEDELSDGLGQQVVISRGGGGSTTTYLVLLLAMLLVLKRGFVTRAACLQDR